MLQCTYIHICVCLKNRSIIQTCTLYMYMCIFTLIQLHDNNHNKTVITYIRHVQCTYNVHVHYICIELIIQHTY